MKKFKLLSLLMAVLFVWLTACGSREAISAAVEDEAESAETASSEEQGQLPALAQMLYFKKLDDSSIMAACDSDVGIELLGGDYYRVHVGAAKIYDIQGKEITLDEIVRGSELEIEWSGAVMESYPGQISADVVRVINDEVTDDFPAEDEIPALFGGPKWWEEEPVLEVPDMGIHYWTELAVVTMRIAPHSGTWRYTEQEYDNEVAIGEENALLDGQHPLDWTYDDNNTILKADIMLPSTDLPISNAESIPDTQSITIGPYPNTKTFTVTAYAVGDDSRKEIPVPVSEGGNITLLDGDAVYVVEVSWDTERYQGSAVYGFLVEENK